MEGKIEALAECDYASQGLTNQGGARMPLIMQEGQAVKRSSSL